MNIRRTGFLVGMMWVALSCEIWAATLNCNGSQSDCQAKVNSAVDGDVVNIPAGTFSWGSAVSWTDKNITLQGQGIGTTVLNLSGTAFQVTDTNKGSFRITGMTLNGGGDRIVLDSSNNSSSVYGWRVDHIRFTGGSGIYIYVIGINWGLVDHCNFQGQFVNNAIEIYSYVQADWSGGGWLSTGAGGYARMLPIHPGSNEALYVEDSTFTPDSCATSGPGGINDSSYSGRMVFRHNTVTCLYFQSHSARDSNRGGNMWMEVYNNTWSGNGFIWPGTIRSGTGVIFNNTFTGYSSNNIEMDDQRATQAAVGAQYDACDGTHSWDGNVIRQGQTGAGWPCMDQIGRGQGPMGTEPSLPFLLWNNGTTSTCASGGTCDNATIVSLNNSGSVNPAPFISTTAHSNGDKDYCVGTAMPSVCGNYTNTYTAYVYPHPLQSSGGGSGPNPPSGLQAVVQ